MVKDRKLVCVGLLALWIACSSARTLANQPPTVEDLDTYTPKEKKLSSYVKGTDADEDTLTFSKITDPSNGTLNKFESDGNFEYTPNTGFTGTDSFTFKANDGTVDSEPGTVNIVVCVQKGKFQTLAPPTSNKTPHVLAISADGNVVVGFEEGTGVKEAVYWKGDWSDQDLTGTGLGWLDPCSFKYSQARGVSGNGSVIVGYSQTGVNSSDAFKCVDFGTMSALPLSEVRTPSGADAWDVSGNGNVIAGDMRYGSNPFPCYWDVEGVTCMKDIEGNPNDDGEGRGISGNGSYVVGHLDVTGGGGYRWNKDSTVTYLGDLPGGSESSRPCAASYDGSVVVGYSGSSLGVEPFRWKGGTMVGLGRLESSGSTAGHAKDVSGDGDIVVGDSDGDPFFWEKRSERMDNFQAMLQNSNELSGQSLTGWTLSLIEGVSGDGHVLAGDGTGPAGSAAWRAYYNRVPIARYDSYNTPKNTTKVVSAPGVLHDDIEIDSADTLKAILVSDVGSGTLTLNENGGFTYVPPTNQTGTYQFTYDANDTYDKSAAATVTIAVYEVMGDCTLNGYVDDDDLSCLLANWHHQDANWCNGDLKEGEYVDDDDLSLLLANWHEGTPPGKGGEGEKEEKEEGGGKGGEGNDPYVTFVFDPNSPAGYKTWNMYVVTESDWTNACIDANLTDGTFRHEELLGHGWPQALSADDTGGLVPNGNPFSSAEWEEANQIFQLSWFDTPDDGDGNWWICILTFTDDADGAVTGTVYDNITEGVGVDFEYDIVDGNVVPAQ